LLSESEKEKLFERILEENKQRLHIFAKTNVRGDNFRDLEQEILLQVWRSLDQYEGRANTKTWFYAVAYNTLLYFNRTNRRPEKTMQNLESLPALTQSVADPQKSRDGIQILEAFIRQLGDIDRTVILMHLDGCSYKEISEATGFDAGALRVRIHRLKKQLAEFAEG
jgi:RNA polymerase sigma-70 factor (ECF subfamily)